MIPPTTQRSAKIDTLLATVLRPTRREFLVGVGSLLFLGAAGCASGGEAGNGGGTTSGGTRTIEHKYGSTEIRGVPERVVSVGFNDQDPILALGVTPVAVRDWFGDQPNAVWPWAQDELEDADPAVLPMGELDFERIATLEPDLIVGVFSGITEDEYGTLSEIAPTIAQPDGYVDYGVPWQEQIRIIGRALGREERAGDLVADVEARFAEAREAHPEFEGATGAVALLDEGGTYNAYGPEDLRGRFMATLGFELPPEIADLAGDGFFAQISEERLDLLDTDVLVWIVNSQEAADALLSLVPRPTAILALSDQLALGVIEAAKERGFSVPEDLSVSGFDDVPEAATSTPPLTTVHQDHARKGALAGRLLVAQLHGGNEEKIEDTNLLPSRLVVRSSTGRPSQ